jgi:hypothetical protein
MFKYLAAGLVGCVAVVAGIWLGAFLMAPDAPSEEAESDPEFGQVSSDINGIPVLQNGQVVGYFVIKVSSVIDRNSVHWPVEDLKPPLMDAAIRAVADFATNGIQQINSVQMKSLTNAILANAAANLGQDAVKAVHVEQFNYVTKAEVRENLFKVN